MAGGQMTARRTVLRAVAILSVFVSCSFAVAATDSASIAAELASEPYRGAILRVSAQGDLFLDEGEVWIARLFQEGAFVHQSALIQDGSGCMIAEVVDLMFHVGVPLDVELLEENSGKSFRFEREFTHYYPWIDWMLAADKQFEIPDKFRYCWPGCYNGLDAHSSWDIATFGYCPVYAGTHGEVIHAANSGTMQDVCIYNPDVGGVVQFGHVRPRVVLGQVVAPTDVIGYVETRNTSWPHIHFSIIRPAWVDKYSDLEWDLRRFSRLITNASYYQDPFYFHEPATWGYWQLETLPEGVYALMREYFERHNPGIGPGVEQLPECGS
jgi:hypothetical protein